VTREGFRLPGARYRCYQFAKELQKYGISTEVLSFSDTLGGKDGEKEREMDRWKKLNLNWKAYKKLSSLTYPTIIFLQRVHYHWLGPFLSRVFLKFPLVIDLDDWEFREDFKKWKFISNSKTEILTRFLISFAKGISVSSHYLLDFYSSYSPFYLPSAVDTEKFKPRRRVKKENVVLSWCGTIHRWDNVENIEFLIKLFPKIRKKYKNVVLEIVGDGYYGELIKRKCEKVEGISFLGWKEPEIIPHYLSSVDIGILPLMQKIKFNLAKSPVKLFEYFASGIPVIASPIGEIPYYLVEGRNGFLAESEDEFIKKILTLIEKYPLRMRMGKEARNTAIQKVSLALWGKKLKDWLETILRQDNPLLRK